MPIRKAPKKSKTSKSRSLTIPRAELKWHDSSVPLGVVPFGLGTLIQNVNQVAQGTAGFERVGRSITIKHIEVKISLQGNWAIGAAVPPNATGISYRVDLVLDKQCNGAAPAPADVYDTIVGFVDPTCRFPNLYNEDRFVFLKRWEGALNPPSFSAVTQSTSVVRELTCSKRLNHRVEFSGPTGAIGTIRSNNLFLIFSCDTQNPLGVAAMAVNTSDSRIRFVDA